MFRLALILTSLFSISIFANTNSGLKIEPYAGYFQGRSEGSGSVAIESADFNSWFAGARVGYETEGGMSFGIDYGQGKGTVELTTGDADFEPLDFGGYLAMTFAEVIRVHASYIFKHLVKVSDGTNDMELTGDGYNIGLGFTGIPQVRIGLIYQIRNIKKVDSVDLSSGNKTTSYMLNVSLPFNIPIEMFFGK